MAEGKRTGDELLDNDSDLDFDRIGPSTMGTPFDQTVDLLAKTEGPKLELFCRSDKPLVEAVQICNNLEYRFGSQYIAEKKAQLMRFSVSINGKGRAELVESLKAGDGVEGEFYQAQAASSLGFSSE